MTVNGQTFTCTNVLSTRRIACPTACSEQQEEDCENSLGQWIAENCECDHSVGPHTPILIDVAGNGYDLTSASEGVTFNIDGLGAAEQLAWTRLNSDDAFLVLDRNGNGTIDNGMELFGDITFQPNSPAMNGFFALRVFDRSILGGNNDGMITSGDAIFNSLRLWQDANHNGVSEPTELASLTALSIQSISLDFRESLRRDRHGNVFRYRSRVYGAGSSDLGRWAYDVILVTSNSSLRH